MIFHDLRATVAKLKTTLALLLPVGVITSVMVNQGIDDGNLMTKRSI